MEQQDLIEAVEEFGTEGAIDDLHDLVADRRDVLAIGLGGHDVAAEIRGQHDQGVAEIDGAAVAIGQPPVIQHLEQKVEDVPMGLFDLVEQDHLIRPPADRFGQCPAFLVADIAGRRPDQARYRVPLHIFRHVDTDHGGVVIEHELGERLAKLRLADPGRAEEHERAHRPARILEPGAGAANGVGDGGDRLFLADHAPGEAGFHVQQFAPLAGQHLVDGNAGPARHHGGDDLVGNLLFQHPSGVRLQRRVQLLFELGDDAVHQFAGTGEVALALDDLELTARLIQLFLELLRPGQLFLFRLPYRRQIGRAFLQLGELLLERLQPVARRPVAFLLQGLALDLELDDAAVQLVDVLGLRIDLHAQAARRLVHQVDGLVGQEAVGDVAIGKCGGGDQRAVGDTHPMVQFVLFLQTSEDRDGVLDIGFGDEKRLETPRQRRVLFDMLAVFIECRGADAMQLATRQRRFEHIRGIHGAFRGAGADQCVQLVYEQDHFAFGGRDFL